MKWKRGGEERREKEWVREKENERVRDGKR